MDSKHHDGPPRDDGAHSPGRRAVLEAYQRALSREFHNIAPRPELTFQQLLNRLQWKGGAVEKRLGPQRPRRSSPGAQPRLQTRMPFRELEALIRTLAGRGREFLLCAHRGPGLEAYWWGGRPAPNNARPCSHGCTWLTRRPGWGRDP